MPADPCPRCRRPLATYDDEMASIGGADVPDGLCWRGVQSSAESDCQIAAERARADALQARLDALAAPAGGVDVEEVLIADQKATPGPWEWDDGIGDWCRDRLTHPRPIAEVIVPDWNGDGDLTLLVSMADAVLITTYRTAAPALAREVVALRAALSTAKGELDIACREWGLIENALDAAGVAATHADGDARSAWNRIALLAEERDEACRALALREGECHEWRAAARIAPAVTCAACGAAQPVPSHASNGQSPCVNCGKTDGLTWPTTPPLDVVALAKERDELRLTLAADKAMEMT